MCVPKTAVNECRLCNCFRDHARSCICLLCSVSETPTAKDKPPGSSATANPGAEATSTAVSQNGATSNVRASAATSDAVTSAADVLQNSGGSVPVASQDTEKQLRNLRKKIRQAEVTAKKAAEGKQLTPEEDKKLTRLKEWCVNVFADCFDDQCFMCCALTVQTGLPMACFGLSGSNDLYQAFMSSDGLC